MNITDRAQKVIAEIDAALVLAEKATPGPWQDTNDSTDSTAFFSVRIKGTIDPIVYMTSFPDLEANAAFIAASRNGYPMSLRCIRTAIEALLQCLESGLNIEKTRWGNDGDCGASNHATDVTYSADKALSEICDQFENNL